MEVMKLRKAEEDDAFFIENLLRENDLPYEDIGSKMDCMFIAYVNERIVGIGGIEVYDRHALLRSLVIEKEFRGKGYGKNLCLKLVDQARELGVSELYLLTTTANTFFEKLGFSVINRNDAPEVIRKTDEFSSLCPSSAICMRKKI
jgi:amino-acid N-acetyltransferase